MQKRGLKITGLVIGGVLVLARLIGPSVPLSKGWSLGAVSGVCNSGLGQLARGMDAGVGRDCGYVSDVMLALTLAAVAGAALALFCGFKLARR